jgi:hypothetical protein
MEMKVEGGGMGAKGYQKEEVEKETSEDVWVVVVALSCPQLRCVRIKVEVTIVIVVVVIISTAMMMMMFVGCRIED